MELWQCRRCGTWVIVNPTITDFLQMQTLLCQECLQIETRDTLQELNRKKLKVFREAK